jgi:hypothetical protein
VLPDICVTEGTGVDFALGRGGALDIWTRVLGDEAGEGVAEIGSCSDLGRVSSKTVGGD